MEIGIVRNRLTRAIAGARERTQQRRERTVTAGRAYEQFLEVVATPLARQIASSLKAEGYSFTVFTPGGGLRLANDRGRDDFIEFALDAASEPAQVVCRVSHTHGSRTLSDERPVKPHTPPDALTEEDVLAFLLDALEPWIER
ncbi:MAG: hypothetical protein A3F70_05915 [Acidobacteria bacterium RIFCSPLOWO2_12_FULL_67_14]|nr:MAG: hypothetical protein A3H29_13415 [Acidobacteria bacterium RIFCSPLOWO2_02_FULL_67_21]OFW41143.1 MAG: hypothetical protein A3F70_05915 [Acidobacteria bacterium RIFCSPLOWO2_12_FULL_67_14]